MRSRGAGVIVNFSSVGGVVTVPGFGYYHASKFAIEGLSETLAQEVNSLGISVVIVEPGSFRTNFDTSLEQTVKVIADYEETVGRMRVDTKEGHSNRGPSERRRSDCERSFERKSASSSGTRPG
jgi:NAD(P)-dependent dehydrogenase (short-subunit alcohol dehydrogenase family)